MAAVATVTPKKETPGGFEVGDAIPNLPADIYTVANALQNTNALAPILVTESGIVIDDNVLHSLNALYPIVVNNEFVGSVIDVKLVQPWNA